MRQIFVLVCKGLEDWKIGISKVSGGRKNHGQVLESGVVLGDLNFKGWVTGPSFLISWMWFGEAVRSL